MPTGALGNVTRHLARLAAEHGHRDALVEPGGGRLSFAALEAGTARFAGGLHAAGVEPGDRLLVLSHPGISFYLALLGALRAGATAVIPDLGAPASWLRDKLARLSLKGMLAEGRAHLLRLRYPELRSLELYVSTGGFCPLPHQRMDRLEGPPAKPVLVTTPALITLAAGITGQPRAIERGHELLEAQLAILSDYIGIGPGDIDLPALPYFTLNSLGAGATCVIPPALRRAAAANPGQVAAWIREHRVTVTSGTTSFFSPLVSWLCTRGEALPALRRLFVGGGRVPVGMLKALRKIAPAARVQVLYGTSEADPIAAADAGEVLSLGGDAAGRGTCVGQPVPGLSLKLWLPGRLEPPGEGGVGEVVVAGRHVNPRYWRDERSTLRTRVPLGAMIWHRTGDLGRRDAEGRLWLVGRVGEEASGRYPLEVEGLAEGVGWVVKAGMVSLGGRAVLAVQVADPPARWRERLVALTRVDQVIEVDEVPLDLRYRVRVDRAALAEQLAGRLSGGGA